MMAKHSDSEGRSYTATQSFFGEHVVDASRRVS